MADDCSAAVRVPLHFAMEMTGDSEAWDANCLLLMPLWKHIFMNHESVFDWFHVFFGRAQYKRTVQTERTILFLNIENLFLLKVAQTMR